MRRIALIYHRTRAIHVVTAEKFPQPTAEQMQENPVVTVRFVAAKDALPVDPTELAR
jgi:hypothetical protein